MDNLPCRTNRRRLLKEMKDTMGLPKGTRSQLPFFGSRGIAAAILIVGLIMIPAVSAENECFTHVTNEDGSSLTGFDINLIKETNVKEKVALDTTLYSIKWDEAIDPPTFTNDEDFLEYFELTIVDQMLTIKVKKTLEQLPDYPTSVVQQGVRVTFLDFSDVNKCNLDLIHDIQDENTQEPTPDKAAYSVEVNEEMPTGVTLQGLQIQVTDNDQTSPNNDFTVSVDANCPLQATEASYTSLEGNSETVQFSLSTRLDFEDTNSYDCTATFKDKGASPLSATATITVTVLDAPDEPPIFTYPYYYTDATSTAASSEPLNISPDNISADDGDTAINSDITYTMVDARSEVNGLDYFEIDGVTGEVTITKDLEEEILVHQRISFIVTGSDGSGDSSSVTLDVSLPTVPTTTPTEVTCPECLCTTTELPTTGTCEPCTTLATEDVTCPETTCPECPSTSSTVTAGTCEPCTTLATENVTCPDTTCPECPSTSSPVTEGTCTPCTSSATESITCPETSTCPECSTTSAPFTEDSTCPECPSTTTCPTICPTTPVTTTTKDPTQPSLTFTRKSYSGEIYSTFDKVFSVEVEVYGLSEESVTFSWADGEDENFAIDSTTGLITIRKNDIVPNTYNLVVEAVADSDPNLHDQAQVNIVVLASSGTMEIVNSVEIVGVDEQADGDGSVLVTIATTTAAKSLCFTQATPDDSFIGRFEVEQQSDNPNKWSLKQKGPLDFETTPQVTLRLAAFEDENACTGPTTTPPSLKRNEAMVIVNIGDINDEKPLFEVPNEYHVIAYPTDPALQKVVGPVITLKATDKDTTGEQITYSLVGDGSGAFSVGEESGAVYVEGDFQCSQGCNFTAKANDDIFETEVQIRVVPLDMQHIFTLEMDNIDVSMVDAELENLSEEIGVRVSKLYVSPGTPTAPTGAPSGGGRLRAKREATLNLQVHVYSVKDDLVLLDLQGFEDALESGGSEVEAQAFTEQEVFISNTTTETDTTGLTVAVAVLGSILGLVLLVALAFFVYRKRKAAARRRGPPSSPISTLGRAYPNQGYLTNSLEREEKSTFEVSKTNGSVNGTGPRYSTAAPLITSVARDSPPLFRSPLSEPAISGNDKSRGLRRTEPGTPEYYGLSSPSAPPSYSRTTTSSTSTPPPASRSPYSTSTTPVSSSIIAIPPTTSSKSPYSSSTTPVMSTFTTSTSKPPYSSTTSSSTTPKPSSSSGLYPTIVTTTPSYNKDKNNGAQDLPLTTFSTTTEISKPKEPRADYETPVDDSPVTTSKFAGLKGSPPPKRAASPPSSEDEKDDEDSNSEDGKKSVAFKVMVETKEIEAQNLGPSQKAAAAAAAKSDAMDILEANKQKLKDGDLSEEDEDEDEDEEEENEKL